MSSAGRTVAWWVALVALEASAAPSASIMRGEYVVGELGVLELSVSGNEVRGVFRRGNRCAFGDGETLLEGVVDGTVLVGKLTTCVEGASCASPKDVPFMGFFFDGTITANVEIERGCSATGITDGKPQVLTVQQTFASMWENAKHAVEAKDLETALPLLRGALRRPEGKENPQLLHDYGTVLNGLKEFERGRTALESALKFTKGKGPRDDERAVLLYNLACAEANSHEEAKAIEHLKEAVNAAKPGALKDEIQADGDLDPLRELPDFIRAFGTKKAPK